MKKHFLIFTVIFAFASLLFAGGGFWFHSAVSKINFEDLNIQFENVELSNPYKSKLIKTTISGKVLDSALSISFYKIRYENDKVFIDIDRKIGSTGMAVDYYIQFLMRPSVKDIYIGKSLFWTRSADSFFKSQNMKFPLNIVAAKDYSGDVAWGVVEREITEQESADVKKFAEHISKTLTFEKCKNWNKNAVAFEICDFGIFAEHDKKYLCMSVDAYFDGAKVSDMRVRVGKHDVSALHNILLFDYDTLEERGWVY